MGKLINIEISNIKMINMLLLCLEMHIIVISRLLTLSRKIVPNLDLFKLKFVIVTAQAPC